MRHRQCQGSRPPTVAVPPAVTVNPVCCRTPLCCGVPRSCVLPGCCGPLAGASPPTVAAPPQLRRSRSCVLRCCYGAPAATVPSAVGAPPTVAAPPPSALHLPANYFPCFVPLCTTSLPAIPTSVSGLKSACIRIDGGIMAQFRCVPAEAGLPPAYHWINGGDQLAQANNCAPPPWCEGHAPPRELMLSIIK